MTKVIHLTEEDARELHAVMLTAPFTRENEAVLIRLRNTIRREFGLVWREDSKVFMRPV